MASTAHIKERQLQRDVARTVESALPGVEVLALELTGKERFCVYVDHPQGVDHALCERVTDVLRPVSRPVLRRGLLTGVRAAAADEARISSAPSAGACA